MSLKNVNYRELPKATIDRLPQYYRLFKQFVDRGIARTNSKEIADIMGVDPATVRRDFSLFGELGRRGYGYKTESLRDFFAEILGNESDTNVAIVGVGNLGHALLNYPFQRRNRIKISQGFDLPSNPLVGKNADNGIPVRDIKDLKKHIQADKIQTVILAVSTTSAQEVAEQLVEAGVHGILNFTPVHLDLPEDVYVQSIDLTKELQTLIFFMRNFIDPLDPSRFPS